MECCQGLINLINALFLNLGLISLNVNWVLPLNFVERGPLCRAKQGERGSLLWRFHQLTRELHFTSNPG